MSEELVHFLASQYDGQPRDDPGPHPDENLWALLADGLIAPSERDALVEHAASCRDCRQRMSAIIAEWPEEVTIASADISSAAPQTQGKGARKSTGRFVRLLRYPSVRYAAAACVAVSAVAYLYFGSPGGPGYGVDDSRWAAAGAPLTDFGVGLGAAGRADSQPGLRAAEYHSSIDTLQARLERPEALALATRAALTARFFDDALEYAARWISRAPNQPDAHNALGLALFHTNRFEEALAAFEQAIKLSGGQPNYHLNAALAADNCDQIVAAVNHLRRFKELVPNYGRMDEIERWLRRISP